MISLPVNRLKPGMITAQSIYNSEGGSYITRGVEMTPQYINRLQKIGIRSITVTSSTGVSKLPPPPDVVDERVRVEAIHSVYNCFEDVKKGILNVKPLQATSQSILANILENQNSLIQLTDLRVHDTYTYAHSVNVAVLAAMLGTHLALGSDDLLTLVLGALLHDLGKIIIPEEILGKPVGLDTSERAVVAMHPDAGRKRIEKLPLLNADVLAKIAGQHHEHIDGNGYPNHIMGNAIHRFSRMVALADVYDALTSNRPYKQAYRPHIAYKIMTSCSPGQFDPEMTEVFFNVVALYPVGTVLKTSEGVGIVRRSEFGRTARPEIVLFTLPDERQRQNPLVIDLYFNPDIRIESVIEDKDMMSLINRLGVDPSIFLENSAGRKAERLTPEQFNLLRRTSGFPAGAFTAPVAQ